MEKPKPQRLGKPYCHKLMLYLIQENGGAMERGKLRAALFAEGYTKFCVYESFRRCELMKWVWYEGSGHSNRQLVHLTDTYEECELTS